MTDAQWETLLKVVQGEKVEPFPVGFIVDSPWLPGWYGITILEYLSHDALWLEANFKATETFPEAIFFPGFWAEFGMCTEPSAFGTRCVFPKDTFPHPLPVPKLIDHLESVPSPNPSTDGLLPFVVRRLEWAKPFIEEKGHRIRFSVSRGPLNIATFIFGTTEFLTQILMTPEAMHEVLSKITQFLKQWHALQRELFPSIDGMLVLDDIIGFLSEDQFKEFGLPYFKELFHSEVSIKFLHNDASCLASAKYLPEMGVNLFNMGFDVDLNWLRDVTQNQVALMGNIPPRDVLASGTPETVQKATEELLHSLKDTSRILFSCGGGMPPGVPTENILAFIDTVKKYRRS